MITLAIIFIKLMQKMSCQKILLNVTSLPQESSYKFDNFIPEGFLLKNEEAILLSLESFDNVDKSTVMELCTEKSKTYCVIDHNAIDFKLNIQNVRIISYRNISNVYKFQYNAIPFSYDAHLEIYSKNSFNLIVQMTEYQQCPYDCKNGGRCNQGICVCSKDYLSHDCSVKAYSILDTQSLMNSEFYFFDTYQWMEQKNKKILQYYAVLQLESTIIMECYAKNPYLLQNKTEMRLHMIHITVEDMNNCLNYSNELGQNQQQQLAYILIKLKQPQFVNLQSSENEIDPFVIGIVVGSICLFILIIAIYCIYRCRRDNEMQKQKLEKMQKMEKEKQLKEEKENQMMPEFLYSEILEKFPGLKNDQECEICLNIFKTQERVRITYCTHIFHNNCIKQWLNKHKTCPMCRQNLDFNQLTLDHDQISKQQKGEQVSINQQPQMIQFMANPEMNTRLYGDEHLISSYLHPQQQIEIPLHLQENQKQYNQISQ
ncbi:unnamed protein product [Paramecium sonneborni]|uniref:RING-type domain-containing protein n=1 Tax=Paramecium sonneborni TaxID=65129 RepID=A0A8S1KN59_9CILI|nr:unnamed protein product [Paramecium sonneborni]